MEELSNEYSNHPLHLYFPNAIVLISLNYINVAHCKLHNTYFPHIWDCCLLCVKPGITYTFALEEVGTSFPTSNEEKDFLRFSTSDELAINHISNVFKDCAVFRVTDYPRISLQKKLVLHVTKYSESVDSFRIQVTNIGIKYDAYDDKYGGSPSYFSYRCNLGILYNNALYASRLCGSCKG
jgi:hypothetical protein